MAIRAKCDEIFRRIIPLFGRKRFSSAINVVDMQPSRPATELATTISLDDMGIAPVALFGFLYTALQAAFITRCTRLAIIGIRLVKRFAAIDTEAGCFSGIVKMATFGPATKIARMMFVRAFLANWPTRKSWPLAAPIAKTFQLFLISPLLDLGKTFLTVCISCFRQFAAMAAQSLGFQIGPFLSRSKFGLEIMGFSAALASYSANLCWPAAVGTQSLRFSLGPFLTGLGTGFGCAKLTNGLARNDRPRAASSTNTLDSIFGT